MRKNPTLDEDITDNVYILSILYPVLIGTYYNRSDYLCICSIIIINILMFRLGAIYSHKYAELDDSFSSDEVDDLNNTDDSDELPPLIPLYDISDKSHLESFLAEDGEILEDLPPLVTERNDEILEDLPPLVSEYTNLDTNLNVPRFSTGHYVNMYEVD